MKRFFLLLLLVVSVNALYAQGVSFSYLIPKNGYLAAPVSPFSVRGIGVGGAVGLETGATLYLTPGLSMEGLPFQSQKPLVGPHFSLLIPGELFINIPFSKTLKLKLLAGGFAWWNIGTRINEGNMDRAFRDFEKWDVLNSNLRMKDRLGIGLMGGFEFEIAANNQFSIQIGAQYLSGSSKSRLFGNYIGGTGGTLETKSVNINDASILLQGLEISLGASLR